jgi:hypothetical protein
MECSVVPVFLLNKYSIASFAEKIKRDKESPFKEVLAQ